GRLSIGEGEADRQPPGGFFIFEEEPPPASIVRHQQGFLFNTRPPLLIEGGSEIGGREEGQEFGQPAGARHQREGRGPARGARPPDPDPGRAVHRHQHRPEQIRPRQPDSPPIGAAPPPASLSASSRSRTARPRPPRPRSAAAEVCTTKSTIVRHRRRCPVFTDRRQRLISHCPGISTA
ncbi:hypothetical protein Dimus_013962, partial [Dionaea muscipula]